MEDNKLPKPTHSDYAKRTEFRKMWNEGKMSQDQIDEELDFLNSLDWSTDLIFDGDKCGLQTALGETILPLIFENFKTLSNEEIKKGDRVVAMMYGKWGVVSADGAGTWLVKPEFDYIGYPNNMTHLCKDGKWGVMDIAKGEFLIPLVCESISNFDGFLLCNGIGTYTINGKTGVIAGPKTFTKAVFEEVEGDVEGPVKVKFEGEWGYIGEDNLFTVEEEEPYYYYQGD